MRSKLMSDEIISMLAKAETQPMRVAVDISCKIYKAFDNHDAIKITEILDCLDPNVINADTMIGILSNIKLSCYKFGEPLVSVYNAKSELTINSLQAWKWSAEDIADAKYILLNDQALTK